MGTVAKIRAAVGLSAPTALEAAQAKFEQAMAESRKAREKLAEVDADIGRLTKAFELEPTDKLADELVKLQASRARAQLYVDRASSLVRTAADAVDAARNAEAAAHLASLDERADTAALTRRLEADWKKRAVPALETLISVLADANSAIDDAQAAAREAHALHGKPPELEFATIATYASLRSLAWLVRGQSHAVRLQLAKLFA